MLSSVVEVAFGDEMKRRAIGALGMILVAGSALPACASVSVLGSGYARSCFEAAEKPRPLREALRACDSALLDDSLAADDRAATLVNRGIVQMQARQIDAAIADYDAAIKLRPQTAEAYINKGIALLKLGDRDLLGVGDLSKLGHGSGQVSAQRFDK
jgi:tetratricopeptide (TPR) repeat protein